jgi:hypothetical protein
MHPAQQLIIKKVQELSKSFHAKSPDKEKIVLAINSSNNSFYKIDYDIYDGLCILQDDQVDLNEITKAKLDILKEFLKNFEEIFNAIQNYKSDNKKILYLNKSSSMQLNF